MKSKFLSVLLVVSTCISILPGSALATYSVEEGDPVTIPMVESDYSEQNQSKTTKHATDVIYVSSSGDDSAAGTATEPYATIHKAVEMANDGNTIILDSDIDISASNINNQALEINNKSITIDGNGHKLSIDNSRRGIRIIGGNSEAEAKTVTFKNISIINTSNTDANRCIETRSSNLTVEILDSKILALSPSNLPAAQTITLGGNHAEKINLNIKNSLISAGFNVDGFIEGEVEKPGYTITAFNPANINVDNSTIQGWTAFNMKNVIDSFGSKGSTINVNNNSELHTVNIYDTPSNSYGAIVLEDNDITVNIADSKVNAIKEKSTDSVFQSVVTCSSSFGAAGNTVNIEGTSLINFDKLANLGNSESNNKLNILGGKFTGDPSEHLAPGKMVATNTDSDRTTYPFIVDDAGDNPAVTRPKDPSVEKPAEDATQEVKDAIAELAPEVKNLSVAVADIVKENPIPQEVAQIILALSKIDNAKDATVVYTPYIDVKVTNADSTSGVLEIDVDAKYDIVATTTPNDIDASSENKNAVVLTTENPLNVSIPMDLSFGITDTMYNTLSTSTDDVIVKHTKDDGKTYYYNADLVSENGHTVSFTAENGFSSFEIYTGKIPTTGGENNNTGSGSNSNSNTQYTITATAGLGGTINTEKYVSVRKGGSANFTFTPDNGYQVADVLVNEKSVGPVNDYTFTDVNSDQTIHVNFKEKSEHVNPQTGMPFEDVQADDWFVDYVYNAVNNGWFSGTSPSTFSPYMNTTRGMIAAILYSMENQPSTSLDHTFTDVPSGAYYENGINWALKNGIVRGYSNDLFGPDDSITREQLAAILYNYAIFKGYDVSNTVSLDTFADGNTTSEYGKVPMSWAVANGLISGKGNGILDPKAGAIRAEVATILTHLDEVINQ